jgi:hypothetical protein
MTRKSAPYGLARHVFARAGPLFGPVFPDFSGLAEAARSPSRHKLVKAKIAAFPKISAHFCRISPDFQRILAEN